MPDLLDELLRTLDVRLHAFATCEVEAERRLVFGPMDAVIVHYVLSGSGVLAAARCDPVRVPSGAIVVVPAQVPHSISPAEEGAIDVLAGSSSLTMADGLMKIRTGDGPVALLTSCGSIDATYGGGFGLFENLVEPLVEDVTRYPEISTALDLLVREVRSPTIITQPLTEAIMKQCLLLLIRSHVEAQGEWVSFLSVLRDPRLARAVLAMLTRPGDAHTLADLANMCGKSRSAFAKRFAEIHERTPFEFLQHVRLKHAARLLSITDLPVKAIANTVGYDSRSHFSRAFRENFGADPSRFRAERRLALKSEPAK